MAKKVPFIKPTRANRPRNAFDLSQRHMFTAHAGMLLPVMSLDLIPHDHVEINATDFMRTLPMNTAAMLSMRGVYEFYFVPYHQLWPQFDQFITGMKDYHSGLLKNVYGDSMPFECPSFSLAKVNLKVGQQDGAVDDLGYPLNNGRARLLDLLGYGRVYDSKLKPISFNGIESHITDKFFVTPFRIAAYNKIYQDFYRNSTYEEYDVKSFSLDKYKGVVPEGDIIDMLKLRYRNQQVDYLTNIRPSQFVEIPSLNYPTLNLGADWSGKSNDVVSSSESYGASVDHVGEVSGDDAFVTLNVSSIRSAFAVDKLMSVTMRAGKTYREQMEAHYGVKVPEGRDGRCTYIGGFDSNIQVSDVDQTSGTTQVGEFSPVGGYLGRTTGKGVGSGSGRVVFDASEHGVLMCIYSIVPDMQYDSTRLDPMVTKKDRFDFFTPEFENLGMQPLYSQYVTMFDADPSTPLGWQPRYSEYKTSLDSNHGQFNEYDSLSFYTSSRAGFQDESLWKISKRSFKISPHWLSSVFVVGYNGSELTDCVFGGCNFNIVKVSDMSVDGMPRV